jgi:tetratricopeptide (TPR) repeat protein
LDPANAYAYAGLAWVSFTLGKIEKGLELYDKGFRLSPRDQTSALLVCRESGRLYFGIRQYDQAIEWARRAIAIDPNTNPFSHERLIAALVLTGHEAKADEALQWYLDPEG